MPPPPPSKKSEYNYQSNSRLDDDDCALVDGWRLELELVLLVVPSQTFRNRNRFSMNTVQAGRDGVKGKEEAGGHGGREEGGRELGRLRG